MVNKKKEELTLVAVGDISPNRDDPPSIFRFCRDAFRDADIDGDRLPADRVGREFERYGFLRSVSGFLW